MIADGRGVRPRARLTGRAGGLERLDLGPIWAAPKWSRATRLVLRPRPGCEIHSKGSIARTRTRALTRAPHTAFMGVFRTDYRLVLDVTVHTSARREPRPGRFLTDVLIMISPFGHAFLAKRAGSIEIK